MASTALSPSANKARRVAFVEHFSDERITLVDDLRLDEMVVWGRYSILLHRGSEPHPKEVRKKFQPYAFRHRRNDELIFMQPFRPYWTSTEWRVP